MECPRCHGQNGFVMDFLDITNDEIYKCRYCGNYEDGTIRNNRSIPVHQIAIAYGCKKNKLNPETFISYARTNPEKSQHRMARELGISQPTVHYYLKRYRQDIGEKNG